MNLLLDTHIVVRYIMGEESLPVAWRMAIQSDDDTKTVSIVSLWELAIKTNIGRLTIRYPLDRLLPADFRILPVDIPHVLAYQQLPVYHRDRSVGPAICAMRRIGPLTNLRSTVSPPA